MSEARKQQHKFSSKKESKIQQRRDVNVQLRKNAREEQMQKRRNVGDENTSPLKSPSKDNKAQSPLRDQTNQKVDVGDANLRLPEIMELFQSPLQRDQLRAVTATRRILSKDERPPVDKVIKKGLIPVLANKLDDKLLQMKFEACWALTNIASGTCEQSLAVANAGAIPKMVNLFNENDDELVDQAVWGLGNLAGDGAALRDMVLKCGTVPGIMRHIRSDKKITYLRNITWMISNLCRNSPAPQLELIGPLLEPLGCLIGFDDRQVQTDASWALSYVTNSSHEHIDAVCNTPCMVDRLIANIARADDDKLITPALRAVGNIITGSDEQTQYCLEKGFLACVPKLLKHKKGNVVKESCWALSNVTAGTKEQVQTVIEMGLISLVVNLLSSSDFKIQKEAVWALTNITSSQNTSAHIEHCVQNNAISGLGYVLGCSDNVINICILDGLTRILEAGRTIGKLENYCDAIEECGALDKIEALQNSDNEDVYKKTLHIVENFFSDEAYEEPGVNQAGYYGFNAEQDGTNQFAF